MNLLGVDLAKLGDQFHGATAGRVLIVDADGPAYVAAATVKTLPTAIRRFQQNILTQMFLAKAESALLHLTAESSLKAGRFNIMAHKPYQGNRTGKDKPALLEALRQAVARPENWLPEYQVTLHHQLEADDGMMQDSYRLKEDGVIWSDDKDLRMTPYPYFEQERASIVVPEGFGNLFLKFTGAGQKKCLGYGRKFFWAQMLMGDTADNVKGVVALNGKQCGPAGAYDYLDPITDESEAANAVIDAYRAINQNPIPEAWLLWLLRWTGDNAWNYFNELQWTPENRTFLDDCVRRNWFNSPTVQDDDRNLDND
jgi:hypothetical protein